MSDAQPQVETPTRRRGGPTGKRVPVGKSGGGRPAYKPTKYDRENVEGMVIAGIAQERIAAAMRMSETALVKHFREVLNFGVDRASGKVARNLVKLSETQTAAAAMYLYNRQPKYWQDRRKVEVKITDDRPDLSGLDEGQLAQLEEAYRTIQSALSPKLAAPVIEAVAEEVGIGQDEEADASE